MTDLDDAVCIDDADIAQSVMWPWMIDQVRRFQPKRHDDLLTLPKASRESEDPLSDAIDLVLAVLMESSPEPVASPDIVELAGDIDPFNSPTAYYLHKAIKLLLDDGVICQARPNRGPRVLWLND